MTASTTLLDLAKSRSKAKAAVKKLELPLLEKLIGTLTVAMNEKKNREEEKVKKERQNKINKINKLLKDSGLGLKDLKAEGTPLSATKKRRSQKKRGSVPPKYRLVVDGVEHLWSGRGKTPLVFAKHFDQGNSRATVEI